MHIRIGTRPSKLAVIQAQILAEKISSISAGQLFCSIVKIQTKGDIFNQHSLASIGGKGLFLKEIQYKLIQKEIDIAVHSFKDVPGCKIHDSIIMNCVLARDDPRDALIVAPQYKKLEMIKKGFLPYNATVGTCSPRRKAILLSRQPDLNILDLRGNIDSRLKKVQSGQYDAIVLAIAGLKRLNLTSVIDYAFSVKEFTPAVGQGAIVAECLKNNHLIRSLLNKITDYNSYVCTLAEHMFLKNMTGNCSTPLGAFATINNSSVHTTKLKFTAIFFDTRNVLHSFNDETNFNEESAIKIGEQAAFYIKNSAT